MAIRPFSTAAASALLGWVALGAVALASAQTPECGNGKLEADEICDDGNLSEDDCCSSTCTPLSSGDPCDDGQSCTVEDACRLGVCVGIPTDSRCGLLVEPLACYSVRPLSRTAESFEKRSGERLRDEFSAEATLEPSLDLLRPGRICLPAGVDGATPPDSAAFESYSTRPDKGTRPFTKRGATIDNGFGRTRFNMSRAKGVLVGSGVDFDGMATPAAASDRRYICYQAAVKGRLPRRELTLSDSRGGLQRIAVGRARTLCVPELSQPQTAHGGSLTCYQARVTDSRRPAQAALITNRYGSEELMVGQLREVCLPTALAPVEEALPPFLFLTATGATNEALRAIYELAQQAPRTEAAAAAAQQAKQSARGVLEADLPAARAALLAALANLREDDVANYTLLNSLLEIVGDSPEILDHLRDLLFRPAQAEEEHQGIPDDETVRQLAVAQLVHHAERGSSGARARLLESLAGPHPGIQAKAIATLYRLNPDRRLIQRAMREVLPLASQYLLYSE